MQFYHHLPCTKAMQRRCVSVYRGRLLGVALPRIPKHCPAGMSTARISTLRSVQLLTFIALHCPEWWAPGVFCIAVYWIHFISLMHSMEFQQVHCIELCVKLCCILMRRRRRNMQGGGGTQWPAGLPVTPDLPGFVPIVHLLRLCPAFVSMLAVVFLSSSLLEDLLTPPLWICPVCVSDLPASFNRLRSGDQRICVFYHLHRISLISVRGFLHAAAVDFSHLDIGLLPSVFFILNINQYWVQLSPIIVNGYEMQPIGGNWNWKSPCPCTKLIKSKGFNPSYQN